MKIEVKDSDLMDHIRKSAWEVSRTWPDWQAAESGLTKNRRPVLTHEDFLAFCHKEKIQLRLDRSCKLIEKNGYKFCVVRDGNKVQIFSPSHLFLVEEE